MARKSYRLEDVVSLSQAMRRPYPQGERRELRQHSLTNGCMVLHGIGGHLIRGDNGLGGDDHESDETEVFEGVQARNGQTGQGGATLDRRGRA